MLRTGGGHCCSGTGSSRTRTSRPSTSGQATVAAESHAADGTTDGYAIAKEPWMDAVYQRGLAWAARRSGRRTPERTP